MGSLILVNKLFGNYLFSYFLSFYFPSVFLCFVSTPSFFKDQEISERNFGVFNFPKHTAWIWISMTKRRGANFDNGFIFKKNKWKIKQKTEKKLWTVLEDCTNRAWSIQPISQDHVLIQALCSWGANKSKKIARASTVDFHTKLAWLMPWQKRILD